METPAPAPARPFPGLLQSVGLLLAGLMGAFLWIFLSAWSGLSQTMAILLSAVAGSGSALIIGLVSARRPWAESALLRPPGPEAWGPLVPILAGAVVLASEIENLVRIILPPPPEFTEMMRQILSPAGAGDRVAALLLAGAVAPVIEELLFRGLIQQGLCARYGGWRGILLSAALFGVYHLQPWQAVPAVALGVLLGWITRRSGSVGYAIALHIANNLLAISLALSVELPGMTPQEGPVVHVPFPLLIAAAALLFWGARLFASRFPAAAPAPFLTPGAPEATF